MSLSKSFKRFNPSETRDKEPSRALSPPHPLPDDDGDVCQLPAYAPPSYTPPMNPPPYHNWETSRPDSAVLSSPPPAFSTNDPNLTSTCSASSASSSSSSSSGTAAAAARGHAFCLSNPPLSPLLPRKKFCLAAWAGRLGLSTAKEFEGTVELKATGGGDFGEIWHVDAARTCPVSNLTSVLPMYFVSRDCPYLSMAAAVRRRKIYYELRVLRMRDRAAELALGFVGKPYPSWRLPGCHRRSVGVCGSDGRRFVNGTRGGVDFVKKFREGDTVGLGVQFRVSSVEDMMQNGLCYAEAFFTRNGTVEGRWRVDEERNVGIGESAFAGFQGEADLYLCVGCFGDVEFEVVNERRAWLFTDGYI